jgi:cytochrome c
MKHILLFLLITLSCVSIIWNQRIEVNLGKGHMAKDVLLSGTSENLMIFSTGNIFSTKAQDNSLPKIKILLSQNGEFYSWNSHIRYSIDVSDPKDGDSKYGEINGNEVLLEIEYLPINAEEEIKKKNELSKKESEHTGLALMKKSTCFGCHADKTMLAGPSFSEIAERYEKGSSTIKSLARHILEGSSGVWGSIEMPSHPDFTVEETEQIADYILEQGGRKNNWVLPGLEGTFRIIQKPDNLTKGVYILTASYTSTSLMKGQHSMILHIN